MIWQRPRGSKKPPTSLRAIDANAAREQRFTQYASHELRTPVTVVQGALELLKDTPEAQLPGVRRPLERIERAVADIEGKPIGIRVDDGPKVMVAAPAGVIEIVLGNIIANAFHYTERGEISIEIVERAITVTDSGSGMDFGRIEALGTSSFVRGDKSVGHGLGLSIVQSLCARFGWTIEMDSTIGVGTRATLRFA